MGFEGRDTDAKLLRQTSFCRIGRARELRRNSLNAHGEALSHPWETYRVFFTTVVLVLSVFINSCTASTCSSRSENALLGFKNSLIDPDGLFLQWEAGIDCCHWPFVTCRESDGAVIALDITASARPNRQPYRNPNCNSQIGSTLPDLTDLEMLKLTWIMFYGPIPSSWGSFSDNLVILIVNNCNLEGPIPSNLGYISNLRRLDLQSNYLTGTIPQKLCNLKELNYLDVSFNNLQSGPIIPWCFQNRPGLWISTGHQSSPPSWNHATHSHPDIAHFFLSFLGVLVSVIMLYTS